VEAQQTKIDEQQATIAELKSTVAQQQKSFRSKLADQERQISALASGLQKVNTRIGKNRPTTKVAVNNPSTVQKQDKERRFPKPPQGRPRRHASLEAVQM
jgi:primosomal protein N''